MGSTLELNDTLRITTEQGFPEELDLARHKENPIEAKEFDGRVFSFHSKQKARHYHQAPTRCFLVHNIGGNWLYWGKILVIEQTITGDSLTTYQTSGKYVITDIYEPAYQEQITRHEAPPGLSYFS